MLEEYIDTLHFAISLAIDLGIKEYKYVEADVVDLNKLFIGISSIATLLSSTRNKEHAKSLLNLVLQLGYQLGFTEAEITDTYIYKNKVNYERQLNGY